MFNNFDVNKREELYKIFDNDFNFFVGDIEAYQDCNNEWVFSLGVLYDGYKYLHAYTIEDYFKLIINRAKELDVKKIYFHNLDFDFLFFLKGLQLENEIRIINSGNMMLSCVLEDITFVNSLAILPLSLKNIVKKFLKIDWEEWEQQKNNVLELEKSELLEYCKRDCFLLFAGVAKITTTIKEKYQIYNFLTIPSLAIKIYKNFFIDKKTENLLKYKTIKFFDEGYYFGGHTEKFINYKYYFDNINYYDVNSLYPYAMQQLDFNVTGFTTVRPTIKNLYKLLYNKEIFYTDITLEIKTENGRVCIMKDLDGSNKFPLGVVRTKVSEITLNYLRKIKDFNIIEIHKIIKHKENEKVNLFKKYVDTFYKLRKEDISNDLIYKLLLNSLYGKFGQKQEFEETVINPLKEFKEFDTFTEYKNNNIICRKKTNLPYKYDYMKKEIAGRVTEYARIVMALYRYNLYKHGIKTIYQDTDSLQVQSDLEEYKLPYFKGLINNKILGKLKKENDKPLNGYILGLKMYCFKDGTKASKGVKNMYYNQYRSLAYHLTIVNSKKIKWTFYKREKIDVDLTLFRNNIFLNKRFTKFKTMISKKFFGISVAPFSFLNLKERLDKMDYLYHKNYLVNFIDKYPRRTNKKVVIINGLQSEANKKSVRELKRLRKL